jgi:dTDP-4-dehydrorhamnose 3,5-epimerase|tara:strand:- start:24228 stop:24773 length:546 start_codon:yes stop_codon:yes gene_type:complete
MKVTETKLKDCFIVEPVVFKDSRGYFYESFSQNNFNKLIGRTVNFVQDNESFSSKGVLRGLHFQTGEHAQAKLVRAIKGTVLDVVVDMRKESPTFSQYFSIELSEDNKKQLFVPRGFAHGFVVLSDSAIFCYKCDNFYNKASERGLRYDDPYLGIDWRLPTTELVVSEKDLKLPTLSTLIL